MPAFPLAFKGALYLQFAKSMNRSGVMSMGVSPRDRFGPGAGWFTRTLAGSMLRVWLPQTFRVIVALGSIKDRSCKRDDCWPRHRLPSALLLVVPLVDAPSVIGEREKE